MTAATDLVTAVQANTNKTVDGRVQAVVAGMTARIAAIIAAPGADQAATLVLLTAFNVDFNGQKDELAVAVRTTQSGVRPRHF